jgi:hypothetical protein
MNERDIPSVIVLWERNIFHSPFQLLDGTSLDYKDVRMRFSAIPENKTLIRQEKNWYTTQYVLAAVSLASALGGTAYAISNLPYVVPVSPVLLGTGVVSLIGTLIANNAWRKTFHLAVRNYNLTVLGIPIQ